MADQFFPQPNKPEVVPPTPPVTPVADSIPKPAAEPTAARTPEPPSLPELPSAESGSSQLARDAHRRTRKRLTIISVVVIVVVVLVVILIWRLARSPEAPVGADSNTPVAVTNTASPTPTLDGQLPGSSSSSSGTAGWPALTADFIQNLTYPTPPAWTTVNGWTGVPPRFTLKNGISRFDAGTYKNAAGQRITVKATVYIQAEALATADIDGDGLADGVALMQWLDNGTSPLPLLYTIIGNQPYTPILNNDVIAGLIGGSYLAQKVTLGPGTLQLQLLYPNAGDATCCWTGQKTVDLRWVDGQWVL